MAANYMVGLAGVLLVLTPLALGDGAAGQADGALPAGQGEVLFGGPAEWIEALGSESFETREAASQALWRRGGEVLAELQEAAKSSDPEVVFRARDLIEKIELGVGPETSEDVRKLVEEYQVSDGQKKLALVGRLLREKAYKQVLRLYALEKDPEARESLLGVVREVAPAAARQAILAGQMDEARSLLEMAPADDRGLASLAAFHRARGTLGEELKRAAAVPGAAGQQWRLALHRAAGDLDAAMVEALALGRTETVAGLRLLQGDPVPWLELQTKGDDVSVFQHLYVEGAVQRWRTNKVEPRVLDELSRAARRSDEEQFFGVNGMFALGEVARGEGLLALGEPELRFTYLDLAERTDEALAVFGLDPAAADYPGWAAKKVAAMPAEDPDGVTAQVLTLAEFLHRRGDRANFRAVLEPLLKFQRGQDEADNLLATFAVLHANGVFLALLSDLEAYTAAAPNAHESAIRWAELVELFYGEEPVVMRWWEYLGRGDDPLVPRDRLRVLEALFGGDEEPQLAGPWVERRLKDALAATGAERVSALEMLMRVTCPAGGRSDRVDLGVGLQVMEELNKVGLLEDYAKLYLHLLTVADRWEDAGKYCRTLMDAQPARLDLGQELAMALRKTGARKESDEWLRRSELLAFGHPTLLLSLASTHQNAGDYEGASGYLRQILIENDPGTPAWMQAIIGITFDLAMPQVSGLAEYAVSRREWALAAALHEVIAMNSLNGVNMYGGSPSSKLVARLTADLARGMRDHRAGKEKQAIEILRRAGEFSPGQGTLADDFFPALREAKLTKLHDELFELSWNHLLRSKDRFPNADNTYNSLAWIGSRASRRLDDAEKFVLRALERRPGQPAYLDTCAEVYFARHERAKAVEISNRAVAGMPHDFLIIRQRERFRKGPFPVP
jgi:tetratricopeptide (TPR) repeat protein